MDHFLVADGDAYQGEYVTIASADSKTVISNAATPLEAVAEAEKAGFPDAILIYVPRGEESAFIF